jgi:hypothetical protein
LLSTILLALVPWLHAPAGWTLVENPPQAGAVRIVAMWKDPAPGSPLTQNVSLGVQRFAGSLDAYAATTRRALFASGLPPARLRESPFACASGPARRLVYETHIFGPPAHIEQILIKRKADVYVATYTRGLDRFDDRAAVAALHGVCR